MSTPIYFIDGKLIAEHGDARVYSLNGVKYLDVGPGHNLWADSDELSDYKHQLKGCNNIPKGHCLEIGLGLGVASNYILSFEQVDTLTTVEVNKDIVELYKLYHGISTQHSIVNNDGLSYMLTITIKFDFIFLDFYSCIDEDTIDDLKIYVNTARKLLKPNGVLLAWLDPYTPYEYLTEYANIMSIPGLIYDDKSIKI